MLDSQGHSEPVLLITAQSYTLDIFLAEPNIFPQEEEALYQKLHAYSLCFFLTLSLDLLQKKKDFN